MVYEMDEVVWMLDGGIIGVLPAILFPHLYPINLFIENSQSASYVSCFQQMFIFDRMFKSIHPSSSTYP